MIENGLAETLRERGVRRDAVYQAARLYVADRLGYPDPRHLAEAFGHLGDDALSLPAEISGDARQLLDLARCVLAEAWDDPAERPRVIRALDGASGRLPAADTLMIALTALAGLHLLSRDSHRVEKSEHDAEGRLVSRTVETENLLALWMRRNRVRTPAATAPAAPMVSSEPGEPADRMFSIVTIDIQGSSGVVERPAIERRAFVRDLLTSTLRRAGMDPGRLQFDDRGDGHHVAIPDEPYGLTNLVVELPGLVAEALRRHRRQPGEPPLRARMYLGTARLRRTADGWDGKGFEFAARFVDAPAARDALEAAPDAVLAAVLAPLVYYDIYWQQHAAPDGYRRIPVDVKDFHSNAYLRLW
ncbi:hypothetical protein [Actinoplanes sp. GCM10030250]|uniref:hypothetical protein n=1 Tax=Actinoplanes sp. GCM10030250 TaxID=3273376 RepID=UPI00361D1006